MFTDNNYQELVYEYGDYSQTLQALKTASTDYDLTGQIVWQAADIFAKFLLTGTQGQDLLAGKSVLEVGSGPGLGGFVASKWARRVVLSDYQDIVLDLMESNISRYNHNAATCPMFAAKVNWEDVKADNYYQNI